MAISDLTSDAPAAGREALLGAWMVFLRKARESTRVGEFAARKIWLEAAAELSPLDDKTLDQTSLDLVQTGRGSDAVEIGAILAALDPKSARAHFRLAHALQSIGDHALAIPSLDRALALEPDFPRGRNNLAAALIRTGKRPGDVIALLEAAVANDPTEAEAWINLAAQRCRAFQISAALEAGARALELAPHSALACNNYSNALKEAQHWDEAEVFAERAVALSVGNPAYELNLGLLHLLRGKYASGWDGYERRWDGIEGKLGQRPVLPGPPWRGESLDGKTLLLWGEEGHGDVLQFCRYVPMLADYVHQRGGRLVWNAFPQFGDLLNRSLAGQVDTYVTGGIPLLPPFDYEFPLLSVARLFETTDETIPARVRYLTADPARAARWRDRLAGEKRLKVGLAWTGSPRQARNPYRSIDPLRYGACFRDLGHVAFYSLQVGGAAAVDAARQAGFDIADHTEDFRTYDDTAAFVDNLDLVITICTSVAHLAGAMGKPTWVLLDANPHWIWRLDQADSLWYPTATLYRQRAFADWSPALNDLARDLKILADKRLVDNESPPARRRSRPLSGAGARGKGSHPSQP